MAVQLRFQCEFCAARPDAPTQLALEGEVGERVFGEYVNVLPGRWLVWGGGGPLGPRRYACGEHRGDLTASLREHYGTVAWQVWKRPPYAERWPGERRAHLQSRARFGSRGIRLLDP
ncbi:MAG TPA: hypothetical protein VHX88_15635 [Solirubrobacteraceae bacterium]|jgi:hypothetical protein|nr:hypothetical protein [Solirubrobacteraceae bacterium]